MHQAAIALHKYACCTYLPFSLCILTRINIVGTGLAIMVNCNAYSKNYGLSQCPACCTWQHWMPETHLLTAPIPFPILTVSTSVMILLFLVHSGSLQHNLR